MSGDPILYRPGSTRPLVTCSREVIAFPQSADCSSPHVALVFDARSGDKVMVDLTPDDADRFSKEISARCIAARSGRRCLAEHEASTRPLAAVMSDADREETRRRIETFSPEDLGSGIQGEAEPRKAVKLLVGFSDGTVDEVDLNVAGEEEEADPSSPDHFNGYDLTKSMARSAVMDEIVATIKRGTR